MWRICFKISSIWFATNSLGCQPVTPEITLSNLHYGYQTLTITLKDFIEDMTFYETNYTFLVSPVTTTKNIKKSDAWDEKKQICKNEANDAAARFYNNGNSQKNESFISSLSLIVLAYRKKDSLLESLKTWDVNGLLNRTNERIIFFQNCATCQFGKLIDPLTSMENLYDKKIQKLLNNYNFTVIGSKYNIGLEKAMVALVEVTKSKNILFLEEDWQLQTNIINNDMILAEQMLNDKFVSAVKFRSVEKPGQPYCSEVWKGYEHLMLEDAMQGGDGKLSIMNAASWQNDDSKVNQFFGDMVWRCNSNFLCGHSDVCGWTNNPTMYSKQWFVENLLDVAKNSNHFESSINLSPHIWSARCWIIAQGKGLFTHVDLEKKLEEQSPCEVPDIIKLH